MKRLLAGSMLCIIGATSIILGQTSTGFSGTWELDKGKSQSLPRMWENVEGVTLVVTQDDKKLTVETKIKGGGGGPGGFGPQTLSYNLDGSETTAEMGGRMPSKAALKAKWLDGTKALELTTVRNLNFQGNEVTITTKERWELAEGGKALKINRTSESPRGTQESTLLFNKQ